MKTHYFFIKTYLKVIPMLLFTVGLLSSCSNIEQVPKDNSLKLITDWDYRTEGIEIPASYTVDIGGYSMILRGVENVISKEFNTGSYMVKVYNVVDNITISGNVATIQSQGGMVDPMPDWLFTSFQQAYIQSGKALKLIAIMEQQVREMTLVVTPDLVEGEQVASFEATIDGVASAVDFTTGAIVGDPMTIKPNFVKQADGSYKATVRMLGTAGADQTLKATVSILKEGITNAYEIESDMSSVLKSFRVDRIIPLELNSTLFAPRNRDITLSGWADKNDENLAQDITDKFTDPIFRAWVKENCAGGREKILVSDVRMVPSVNIIMSNVASLKGIEYFTSLAELNCTMSKVTQLDLSANKALKVLYCATLGLTSLDLSANTELTFLGCSENNLTTLDVSKNTKLQGLSCYKNKIKTIDLSNNKELEIFFSNEGILETVDLSANTNLKQVYVQKNNLTQLILPANDKLNLVYCYENKLTALDLTGNPGLVELFVSTNELAKLDLSKNTKLEQIYCDINKLTELILPKSATPKYIFCSTNLLSELDISANTNLEFIAFNDNPGVLKTDSYVFTLKVWPEFESSTLYYMVSAPWEYEGNNVAVEFVE